MEMLVEWIPTKYKWIKVFVGMHEPTNQLFCSGHTHFMISTKKDVALFTQMYFPRKLIDAYLSSILELWPVWLKYISIITLII